MNLLDFIVSFPSEEACRNHFQELRSNQGICCKRCGCTEHYWLTSKSMWQCKKCRFRTSLRSGTVMENSKLPFRYWYIAIHLLTATKKTFSAVAIQGQIGHKRYEPIWAMLHKIRMVMGQIEDRTELMGWVEMDKEFFRVRERKRSKSSGKRYSSGKSPATVMVMAESTPVARKKKNGKIRKCGRFRMVVIPDTEPETIASKALESVDREAMILTDEFEAYDELRRFFRDVPALSAGERTMHLLPWVRTAITNSGRILEGIFHGVGRKYLQNYLDEFCYKLNRRYFGEALFGAMLGDSLIHWDRHKNLWHSAG